MVYSIIIYYIYHTKHSRERERERISAAIGIFIYIIENILGLHELLDVLFFIAQQKRTPKKCLSFHTRRNKNKFTAVKQKTTPGVLLTLYFQLIFYNNETSFLSLGAQKANKGMKLSHCVTLSLCLALASADIEITQSGLGFDWKMTSTSPLVTIGSQTDFPTITIEGATLGTNISFSGQTGDYHYFAVEAPNSDEVVEAGRGGQPFSFRNARFTLKTYGTYLYFCPPHKSSMKGDLVIVDPKKKNSASIASLSTLALISSIAVTIRYFV